MTFVIQKHSCTFAHWTVVHNFSWNMNVHWRAFTRRNIKSKEINLSSELKKKNKITIRVSVLQTICCLLGFHQGKQTYGAHYNIVWEHMGLHWKGKISDTGKSMIHWVGIFWASWFSIVNFSSMAECFEINKWPDILAAVL